MIIDGRHIAKEILSQVRANVQKLGAVPIVRVITLAPSPATKSYLKIKEKQAREAGMKLEVLELQEDAGTDEVIHAIKSIGADAVLVQLPLPASIDTKEVLNAIPVERDADVLSDKARSGSLLPPVVGAVKEILEHSQVSVEGKGVVVLGRGWLVGEPIAKWLEREGALVASYGKDDFDSSKLKQADIIVSGVGQAGLIKKEDLKEGVVLIDAGTSESGGALAGDIEPDCAEVASVFTPVPGGVGPIAVAYLFQNVLTLKQSSLQVF